MDRLLNQRCALEESLVISGPAVAPRGPGGNFYREADKCGAGNEGVQAAEVAD